MTTPVASFPYYCCFLANAVDDTGIMPKPRALDVKSSIKHLDRPKVKYLRHEIGSKTVAVSEVETTSTGGAPSTRSPSSPGLRISEQVEF